MVVLLRLSLLLLALLAVVVLSSLSQLLLLLFCLQSCFTMFAVVECAGGVGSCWWYL